MSINPREFADDFPNNSDRADWAAHALSLFCEETGLDPDIERREAVSDLLCNLGHFCDRNELDFLVIASSAIGVWDAEKRKAENGEADAMHPKKNVIIALLDPTAT